MSDAVPAGYTHEPSTSAFVNHVGKVYNKVVTREDGTKETWAAILIEPHHVNTWGFAHGGFMAACAEIGTGGGYEAGGYAGRSRPEPSRTGLADAAFGAASATRSPRQPARQGSPGAPVFT